MAKELPYFQFEPAEYLAGSIQFCSIQAQGLYINTICIYWQRNCQLTLEQLKKRFNNAPELDELIQEKILKVKNGNISIDFLDNQFKIISEISQKRSESGKVGASSRWQIDGKRITNASQTDSKSMPIREDKIKGDKIRQDKKKRIETPTLPQVEKYFDDNGYTQESAKKAFDYYDSSDWFDSKGNKVHNWKQKMIAVWFKPENLKKGTERKMVY